MGRLCYPTQAPGRILVPRPEYSGGPENCHGARRVWRTYCRSGKNFYKQYACRGTILISERICQYVTNVTKWPLEQCRGTSLIEARKLSRCIEFILQADARVRVQETLRICLECRSKSKKCDKQLTHIVRVTVSILLKLSFGEQFKERIIYIVICCPQFLFCQEFVIRKLIQIICCSYP